MKRTLRRQDCSPELASWVENQSRNRSAPPEGDVLLRRRNGVSRWVPGALALVTSVGVMAWDARNLYRFGHSLDLPRQAIHAAIWSAAVLLSIVSVKWLATFRSPWRRALVVIPGAVVRITENRLEHLLLADLRRIHLTLSKGGARVELEDSVGEHHTVSGAFGFMSWMGGDELCKAIEAARPLPNTLHVPEVMQPPLPVLRWLGATVALFVVTTGVMALVAQQREAAVRELINEEALNEKDFSSIEAVEPPAPVVVRAPKAPVKKPAPAKTTPPLVTKSPGLQVTLEAGGSLPPEVVKRIVGFRRTQFTECLEGQSTKPVSLRFEIDARGTTRGSVVSPSSSTAASCLQGRSQAMSFPQSNGSTTVNLVLASNT